MPIIETRIKQIPTGKWKENCYVINNRNKDALIIDPGADKKSIVNYIEYNNKPAEITLRNIMGKSYDIENIKDIINEILILKKKL